MEEYRDYTIELRYTYNITNPNTGEKRVEYEGIYFKTSDPEDGYRFRVKTWTELKREIDDRIFEKQEWIVGTHPRLTQKFTFLSDAMEYISRNNAVPLNFHFTAM